MKTFLPLRPIVILLVFSLISASCTILPGKSTPSPARLEAEEYAVYSAVIQDNYVDFRIEQIAILDHTQSGLSGYGDVLSSLKNSLSGLTDNTISSYQARNDQSYPLQDRFNLKVKVVFFSQAEIDELFKAGGKGWDEFYIRYPASQGTMALSRVGFNPQMNQALLYIGNQSAPSAGAGYFYLLTRQAGKWIIQQKMMLWIS